MIYEVGTLKGPFLIFVTGNNQSWGSNVALQSCRNLNRELFSTWELVNVVSFAGSPWRGWGRSCWSRQQQEETRPSSSMSPTCSTATWAFSSTSGSLTFLHRSVSSSYSFIVIWSINIAHHWDRYSLTPLNKVSSKNHINVWSNLVFSFLMANTRVSVQFTLKLKCLCF